MAQGIQALCRHTSGSLYLKQARFIRVVRVETQNYSILSVAEISVASYVCATAQRSHPCFGSIAVYFLHFYRGKESPTRNCTLRSRVVRNGSSFLDLKSMRNPDLWPHRRPRVFLAGASESVYPTGTARIEAPHSLTVDSDLEAGNHLDAQDFGHPCCASPCATAGLDLEIFNFNQCCSFSYRLISDIICPFSLDFASTLDGSMKSVSDLLTKHSVLSLVPRASPRGGPRLPNGLTLQ